ncbi:MULTISPECIES: quercetin 2,3-dioxygenase [Streptomyces]|uniref:quercetin 2,3-dioxygenase n=1 Tax=Streptomyces TaxID=1883 RepID=UPI00163B917C|nr:MULTISPECIES: quercetin 2,3-dioxygenase [Streptomyces]MBC2879335.1 quercetin 2,3-dioxygenase [Streptomyces sp. TYQ1024]UBI40069.1 quercetin 2,3-dioxygenase [Streptomyces mobaraensis]UKW32648.1 quercetin 2,3-dioxygenase [Streptomyces sp. TYQ1024]
MSIGLEAIHTFKPVRNELPGEPVPYYVANGEGKRYELDGQLWTVIARIQDTGGLFDASYVSGGRGAATGFHAYRDHQRSFMVVKGSVQVWLGGESRVLVPGDSFNVPAGAPLAYRFLAHHTRMVTWSAPGGALDFIQRLGTPVDRHIHPNRPEHSSSPEHRAEVGALFGVTFPTVKEVKESLEWDATLPQGVEPYFLRAGEGDRLAYDNGLHSYLSRGRNTDHQYFAVLSQGGPSQYFARHFHEQHTENFLCLSGRIWMHVNGEEVLLTAGDFLHAPAGTIHTFAFDAHQTELLGVLTPDIFEPFFPHISTPTQNHVYDEASQMAMVGPPPVAMLQKIQEELDLVIVGAPPEREIGLGI